MRTDADLSEASTSATESAFRQRVRGIGGAQGRWARLPGTAATARYVDETIERVSQFDCPVLITGESGCGKEEVARAIHAASARHDKPFVAVNCGGLVTSLAESQLFGHERGSFTGAIGSTVGAFRSAHGGILFLDEIGELPLELQPKLLQVLQRLEVTPVGSTAVHRVDVQVIAATNRDLEAAVDGGGFREDLFYRLNTIHIVVPPLRARKEDIPRFIAHFAAHFAEKYGRPIWQPEPDVLERLVAHPWPGNVRQLAQTIQRLYVFEDRRDAVLAELLGAKAPVAPSPSRTTFSESMVQPQPAVQPLLVDAKPAPLGSLPERPVASPVLPVVNLAELRRLAVRQTMADTGGHRGRAAAMLGVSLNTMTRLVAEACPELAAAMPRGRKRSIRPR